MSNPVQTLSFNEEEPVRRAINLVVVVASEYSKFFSEIRFFFFFLIRKVVFFFFFSKILLFFVLLPSKLLERSMIKIKRKKNNLFQQSIINCHYTKFHSISRKLLYSLTIDTVDRSTKRTKRTGKQTKRNNKIPPGIKKKKFESNDDNLLIVNRGEKRGKK